MLNNTQNEIYGCRQDVSDCRKCPVPSYREERARRRDADQRRQRNGGRSGRPRGCCADAGKTNRAGEWPFSPVRCPANDDDRDLHKDDAEKKRKKIEAHLRRLNHQEAQFIKDIEHKKRELFNQLEQLSPENYVPPTSTPRCRNRRAPNQPAAACSRRPPRVPTCQPSADDGCVGEQPKRANPIAECFQPRQRRRRVTVIQPSELTDSSSSSSDWSCEAPAARENVYNNRCVSSGPAAKYR